jgi:formiminoglutamase
MTGASMTAARAPDWLLIHRGTAPLIVSFPHTGTLIPPDLEARLQSPWLGRKDADWWVHDLYDFAEALGATTIRTCIARTVIDVNRDPSGRSLYPGQATTGLCPLTSFDGEPLYQPGQEPDDAQIARRRDQYFDPYHAALGGELRHLRAQHPRVVLYDAHSIRSRVSQLFAGELPNFNLGTNGGVSCDPALTREVERRCTVENLATITNGRFRGGWITRHYGEPSRDIHAIQMELAMRGYLDEPDGALTPDNWPPPFDATRAAALRQVLTSVLRACLEFARARTGESP